MTAQIKRRRLFSGNWIFLRGAPSLRFLPPEGPAEIAFAGRSNVGKSSLINALVGKKGLARTSNTPGRTQELNFFVPLNYGGGQESGSGQDGGSGGQSESDMPPFALVDMPGYGFARAPKAQIDAWTKLIFAYLRGRSTLKRVYVLIDARHGIMDNDKTLLDMLDKAAVSYQIMLTKTDKIKPEARDKLQASLDAALAARPAAYPHSVMTSAETGDGLDEAQDAIITLLGL